jgi:hypothetical protein
MPLKVKLIGARILFSAAEWPESFAKSWQQETVHVYFDIIIRYSPTYEREQTALSRQCGLGGKYPFLISWHSSSKLTIRGER